MHERPYCCLVVRDAVTGGTLHALHLDHPADVAYPTDVTSIAYAPIDPHIAVGTSDVTVFFFEVVSQGVVIGDTSPGLLSNESLAYSPNGTRLAAAGADVNEGHKVIILESVTGTVLREIRAPGPAVKTSSLESPWQQQRQRQHQHSRNSTPFSMVLLGLSISSGEHSLSPAF